MKEEDKIRLLTQADLNPNDEASASRFCDDPAGGIAKAIQVGAPTYNSGNHMGCFLVYHAAARTFAKCQLGGNSGMRTLMEIAANVSEHDASGMAAAWRLRRAFDAY